MKISTKKKMNFDHFVRNPFFKNLITKFLEFKDCLCCQKLNKSISTSFQKFALHDFSVSSNLDLNHRSIFHHVTKLHTHLILYLWGIKK